MGNEFIIRDRDGNALPIVTIGGENKLPTDAQTSVTVEELLGIDDFASSFFRISTSGAVDDTVRVRIDSTVVDVTSTLTATEAGDIEALATLIKNDLNSDEDFSAKFIAKSLYNIVFISALDQAEKGEYPDDNDLDVDTTGTTVVTVDSGYDKILTRSKKVIGEADPTNPRHIRLGIFGEVGSRTKAENPINFRVRKSLSTSGQQIFADKTVESNRVWYITSALMANDLASEMSLWHGYQRDKTESWEADGTLFTHVLDYGCLTNSDYHTVTVNGGGSYSEGTDYVIEDCPTDDAKSQLRWIKSQSKPANEDTVQIVYDAVVARLGVFVPSTGSQPYSFDSPIKMTAGNFLIATVQNKSANTGISIVNVGGYYEEI